MTAFKKEADEKGTPFVEVGPEVVDYIKNQDDKCVREMFSRMVAGDGEVTALYPFKRLGHSFAIGGLGLPPGSGAGLPGCQIRVAEVLCGTGAAIGADGLNADGTPQSRARVSARSRG